MHRKREDERGRDVCTERGRMREGEEGGGYLVCEGEVLWCSASADQLLCFTELFTGRRGQIPVHDHMTRHAHH